MSYCIDCIHYKVCGNEGIDDSAMTFCADKQTDKDLISRQDVEDAIAETIVNGESLGYAVAYDILSDIPSAKTDGDLISCLNGWNEVYKYILEDIKENNFTQQKMRFATKKEQESIDNFIKEISKPTGINFFEQDNIKKAVLNIPSAEKTDGDLISRQEVLKCFNIRELKFKDKEDAELMKHYLELTFDDLVKLPSYNSIKNELKTELNGDLISRKAVKDLIRGLTKWSVKSQDRKYENVGLLYDDVMFGIDRLPSAEKTAEWISKDISDFVYCSNCDFKEWYSNVNNYCPNCGARMKVVE